MASASLSVVAQAKREEEARAKQRAEEEEERKERAREEARRRAAMGKQQETEAWWLQYRGKEGDKSREIAKLKARLARFKKIAEATEAEGERENAMRLAEQAEQKLMSLMEEE